MICCTGQCRDRSSSPAATNPSNNNNRNINNNNNNNNKFNAKGFCCAEEYLGAEMKRAYSNPDSSGAAPAPKVKCDLTLNLPTTTSSPDYVSDVSSLHNCKVFLGGACNPTTWRKDIAIPLLKKLGLTYYNPQVSDWSPDLVEAEHIAKSNAEVLFFVIDNKTRGTVAAIEVAYSVAKQKQIIVVINGFKRGQKIGEDVLSSREFEDLSGGQQILQELIERHGIPVFNDIETAIHCTSKVIKEQIRPQDLRLADLTQLLKIEHIQNPSIRLWIRNCLKKTFDCMDVRRTGKISLSDFPRAFEILMNRRLVQEDVRNALSNIGSSSSKRSSAASSIPKSNGIPNRSNGSLNGSTVVDFDQFCQIMAEIVCPYFNATSSDKVSSTDAIMTKSSGLLQTVFHALYKVLDNMPTSQSKLRPVENKAAAAVIPPKQAYEYDVFLCGPSGASESSWETDVVVPMLKTQRLKYILPDEIGGQSCSSCERLLPSRNPDVEKCRLLFFYVPANTRSLDVCLLAVYYIGLGCQVVLCVEEFKNDCQIQGEQLSPGAAKDYSRLRSYLTDMATREGARIFTDLQTALNHIVETAAVSK